MTTDQFQLFLKAQAKEGLVTDQIFENLNQVWKLRFDGSVDEDEYEENLRMILKELQPGGGVGNNRTRDRVAGAPCSCCSSSSSGVERRKGES